MRLDIAPERELGCEPATRLTVFTPFRDQDALLEHFVRKFTVFTAFRDQDELQVEKLAAQVMSLLARHGMAALVEERAA